MEQLLDRVISEQSLIVVLSLACIVYLVKTLSKREESYKEAINKKEEDRKAAWTQVNTIMKENNEVLAELSTAIKVLYELEKDRINR